MAKPLPSPDLPPIERLRELMHLLRSPGGCPWDAEQTHDSLVKHLIEEAYEVAEAVESGDKDALQDELGDILLQPVFHAEIASETGGFTLDDIAETLCQKLIRRHPHVFGDASADSSGEVVTQWEAIKEKEKGSETAERDFFLKKANQGLPSLMAAQKLQRKVAKVGFDWPSLEPVLDKVREELDEVEEALESENQSGLEEEIGDLLFAIVNLARKCDLDAELTLDQANRKFVSRFQGVERALRAKGRDLESSTLEEMDQAWNDQKNEGEGL